MRSESVRTAVSAGCLSIFTAINGLLAFVFWFQHTGVIAVLVFGELLFSSAACGTAALCSFRRIEFFKHLKELETYYKYHYGAGPMFIGLAICAAALAGILQCELRLYSSSFGISTWFLVQYFVRACLLVHTCAQAAQVVVHSGGCAVRLRDIATTQAGEPSAADLRQTRSHYVQLSTTTSAASACLGAQLGCLLAAQLFQLANILSRLVVALLSEVRFRNESSTADTVVAIADVGGIFILLIHGSILTKRETEMKRLLCGMVLDLTHKPELIKEAEWFAIEMLHNNLAFHVEGMFNANLSLLESAATTLFVYLSVVVQTRLQEMQSSSTNSSEISTSTASIFSTKRP